MRAHTRANDLGADPVKRASLRGFPGVHGVVGGILLLDGLRTLVGKTALMGEVLFEQGYQNVERI